MFPSVAIGRASGSGVTHNHEWGPGGYCQKRLCPWRKLASGMLVRPLDPNVLSCNCECHYKDAPAARWRVQIASRVAPQYPSPATRALCPDCYREARRGEGFVHLVNFVLA